MRVRQLTEEQYTTRKFCDRKQHELSAEVVMEKLTDWFVSTAHAGKILITAPNSKCESFYADLKGTINRLHPGFIFFRESDIADMLDLDLPMTRAWLWSCEFYNITQREYAPETDEYLWVIE